MGYLERLFLGTMLLTALLILFLFGLYFDVGGMIAGTFRGGRFGEGVGAEVLRSRERLVYSRDDQRADNRPLTSTSTGPRSRPSSPVNFDRYVRRPPTVPKSTLVDREVRRLQREGFTDEEYITMTALYEVDRSLVRTFDEYDRLVEAEDYDAAIALLLDAKKHVDPENPLALRDILQYLGQAYVLAGKDAEARDNLSELTRLQERILAIEERAELHQDKASQEYLVKMRERFSQVRTAMDKLEQLPASAQAYGPFAKGREILENPDTLPVSQRAAAQLKAELSRRVGQSGPDGISEEEMREVLRRLEVEDNPPKDLSTGH